MMNFIMLVVAIYMALVAASLTIIIVATSKWYTKKCTKLTKNIMDDFDEV